MARRKGWAHSETKLLVDNYKIKSIQELMVMFPTRSQDSINSKIKQLKAKKKINEKKLPETVIRAYKQRS